MNATALELSAKQLDLKTDFERCYKKAKDKYYQAFTTEVKKISFKYLC